MSGRLSDLVESWKRQPDERSTIALCEQLGGSGETHLVDQVGKRASISYASNPRVLVAVARMYLHSSRLGEAQGLLVSAGKMAPNDSEPFRWLGEVLLRRGDAERASKVLEQAITLGRDDQDTHFWCNLANGYLDLQKRSGTQAVVTALSKALMQKTLPPPPRTGFGASNPSPREPPDEDSWDTELTVVRNDPSKPAPAPAPLFASTSSSRSASAAAALFAPAPSRTGRPPSMPPPPKVSIDPSVLDPSIHDQPTARNARPVSIDDIDVSTDDLPQFALPADPGAALAASSSVPGRAPGTGTQPRDVLGALEAAGVFEPASADEASTWATPPKPRTRFSTTLIVITILVVGAGVGVLLYMRDARAKQAERARALNNEVTAILQSGKVDELAGTEAKLSQAFDLDPNSSTTALLWVTNRVLRLLQAEGESQGIDSAIARARQTGVPDSQLAFARIASFLAQGDLAGAGALVPQWDDATKKDAMFQLLAGVTLERAGDHRAIERYQLATNLDPELVPAQVMLTRAMILEGDRSKAAELVRNFRTKHQGRAEAAALTALAWARDPARGTSPLEAERAKAHREELPVALRVVPSAIEALQALEKGALLDAKTAVIRALGAANTPGVATWLGTLALQMGDDSLARRAALQAVSFSAVYPPARVLSARVALSGGRLDEAVNAVAELDSSSPEVAIVRAAVAYERLDVDGLAAALQSLPLEARERPEMSALLRAADVMRGLPVDPGRLRAMAGPEVVWGDIVAIDAALDAGNLTVANELIDRFRDAKDRPPRALRVARHLRYTERAPDADGPSNLAVSTPTARSIVERVLVLLATNKADEARALVSRTATLLGPMASWLVCYIDADGKSAADARARAALLEPPGPLAPLLWRTLAALTMGDLGDKKRGLPYVRTLVKQVPRNPDVLIAAEAFRR